MAVNRDTLRLLDGLRVAINGHVDHIERALIAAWGAAWNEVAAEWDAAIQALVAASKDGRWPNAAQVRRAKRARDAMAATREHLQDLAKTLPVTIAQVLPKLTDDTIAWSHRIIASELPKSGAHLISTVDADALAAIVKRTTEQITALSRPLSAQAEAAMRGALIRGIAVGDNPRRAGLDMFNRIHGHFDGGLTRSLLISRTEMLDAHRSSSLLHDKANTDILGGWEWLSALDRRTCPACWAKHGTTHRVDEPGPNGHQQCRCTRVPVTKSWADLGFKGIDEPASLMPDAQDVFATLSREDQLAVMGRRRLELLDSGDIDWSDLAVKRTTKGWRDSFVPTPVGDLLAKSA